MSTSSDDPNGMKRAEEWEQTSCGGMALWFVGALILVSGIGWAMFGHNYGNPTSGVSGAPTGRVGEPGNPSSMQQAASSPTNQSSATRDYTPGSEPVYEPNVQQAAPSAAAPKAKFTIDWDKKTGILRLDASASTPGYTYSWYFGWSVGLATGTTPSNNPLYVTMVQENQISGAGKNWVVLNLINDHRQIMASDRELLPQ